MPARFSYKEKDFGSVDIGKKADLVLLNNNPLLDINNTKSINGLLLNGVYYNREKLRELKQFTASAAGSFQFSK